MRFSAGLLVFGVDLVFEEGTKSSWPWSKYWTKRVDFGDKEQLFLGWLWIKYSFLQYQLHNKTGCPNHSEQPIANDYSVFILGPYFCGPYVPSFEDTFRSPFAGPTNVRTDPS